MGQITNPSAPGIQVRPIDRESGPGAGAGASGNRSIFLGLNAGLNATTSDVIVIGNHAFGGVSGGFTGTTLNGTVAIGSQALANVTVPGLGDPSLSNIAIGFKSMLNTSISYGNVAIGQSVMENQIGIPSAAVNSNVVIGDLAAQNVNPTGGIGVMNHNVIVGFGAASPAPGRLFNFANCVVIGANAANGMTSDSNQLQGLVAIGAGAVANLNIDDVSGNNPGVFIGNGCASGMTRAHQSVIIGDTFGSATCHNAVAIGSQANSGTIGTVIIGASAGTQGGAHTMAANAIVIGFGAGSQADVPANDVVIENFDGFTLNTFLWGNALSGNAMLGHTTFAARDLPTIACTNALKLTDGTRGAGNPSAGGFFYSLAGALHWVGSAGTDTVVAPA